MIFVVQDEHDARKDRETVSHVFSASKDKRESTAEGDYDIKLMRNYINYCRRRCAPMLSPEGADKMVSKYAEWRHQVRDQEEDLQHKVYHSDYRSVSSCAWPRPLNAFLTDSWKLSRV